MLHSRLEKITSKFGEVLGTSSAFLVACLIFLVWLCMATLFRHNEDIRLFIVELTGLFIFIHLFVVQRNQNKDIKALHIKLDEIIATLDGANNQLIKAEQAPESIVDELHEAYSDLASSLEHPTKPVSLQPEFLEQTKEKRRAS